jgi:3-hydroxy acid dehydrogenase/malonic semialdehyde reductase
MIVFVTGPTAGFGLTIARRFATDGARIIAAGRRRDRLEALVATRPARAKVNLVQVMPVAQGYGTLRVHRG